MGKILKIKATSLVYNSELNSSYKDNVFVDDKYLEDFDISKIQISADSEANDVLYALSSGFDVEVDNLASNRFSFMNVLHENYNDLKNQEISMQIRMREIGVTIDSAREFLMKVNETKAEKASSNISFAGILFSNNKASILCTGKSRIFLFRDKYLKLISDQPDQVDEMIKNGSLHIDNIEPGADKEGSSETQYTSSKILSENFDVKEGDIFILCSEGCSGVISDDSIYEQLSQNMDLGQTVTLLMKAGISVAKDRNISMVALEVKSVPTEIMFEERPVVAAGGSYSGSSQKTRSSADLFETHEENDYPEGVPFLGFTSEEPEPGVNKKMVAGVVGLSAVLLILLIISGIMIFNMKGQDSTYTGINVSGQPTEEATPEPSAIIQSTTLPKTTTPPPTLAPSATVKPTPTKKVATPTPKTTVKPTPSQTPAPTPTAAPTTNP